jgi:hypothetical protein
VGEGMLLSVCQNENLDAEGGVGDGSGSGSGSAGVLFVPSLTAASGSADTGVHYAPSSEGIPGPISSAIPASQVFGVGMGGGARPSQYYTTVLTSSSPSPLARPFTRSPQNLLSRKR